MHKGKIIIAIIPARAGSRRIRGKNVKLMAGKPLFEHSVDQANASRYIDAVYLTTDDSKIIKLAEKLDVQVIKRPKKYATASTVMDATLAHALTCIDPGFEMIVLLQPTSPLRSAKTIDKAVRLFTANYDEYDSLMPLRRAKEKMGIVRDSRYVPIKTPTLDGKAVEKYIECGTVFVYKAARLAAGKPSTGKRIYPFVIDDYAEAIDVDLYEEFLIAEQFKRSRDRG